MKHEPKFDIPHTDGEQLLQQLEGRMTSSEYAYRHFGLRCPFCRSERGVDSDADINAASDINPDWGKEGELYSLSHGCGAMCNVVYIRARCEDCGKKWHDIYRLTGYAATSSETNQIIRETSRLVSVYDEKDKE